MSEKGVCYYEVVRLGELDQSGSSFASFAVPVNSKAPVAVCLSAADVCVEVATDNEEVTFGGLFYSFVEFGVKRIYCLFRADPCGCLDRKHCNIKQFASESSFCKAR